MADKNFLMRIPIESSRAFRPEADHLFQWNSAVSSNCIQPDIPTAIWPPGIKIMSSVATLQKVASHDWISTGLGGRNHRITHVKPSFRQKALVYALRLSF
jgi:hypothetical protein